MNILINYLIKLRIPALKFGCEPVAAEEGKRRNIHIFVPGLTNYFENQPPEQIISKDVKGQNTCV